MIIERFKDGAAGPIRERFRGSGRLLPEGVVYQASWVEPSGARCFQVMEAPDRQLLELWVSRWDDLINFEIIPVLTSSDYWSRTLPEQLNDVR